MKSGSKGPAREGFGVILTKLIGARKGKKRSVRVASSVPKLN